MKSNLRFSIVCLVFMFYYMPLFSQNLKTSEGLKTGYWEEVKDFNFYKILLSGKYIIIPDTLYDIIEYIQGFNAFYANISGSKHIISYDGVTGSHLSVNDSFWTVYQDDKLIRQSYYSKGLRLWTKSYDENEMLKSYEYIDIENDSNVIVTYREGQVFLRTNKNFEGEIKVKIYYPHNQLYISNAEFRFSHTFGEKTNQGRKVYLSGKEGLELQSLKSTSGTIVIEMPVELPYVFKANDTILLNLNFEPTAVNFVPRDTLLIITSEKNMPTYKIYSELKASHINEKNLDSLQEITLSRINDRYLFVYSLGTQTSVTITDLENGNNLHKTYNLHSNIDKNYIQVELNDFPVGSYKLKAWGCHIGNEFVLKIIE